MEEPARPNPSKRLRFAAFIWGVLFFLWLSFEDSSLTWLLALSISILVFLAAFFLARYSHSPAREWKASLLAGILAGFLVTPLGFLLMAVKTGLHGHLGPDFSADQISVLWRSTPIWVGTGILVGSGLAVLARGRQNA